jgi:hypothetical protein
VDVSSNMVSTRSSSRNNTKVSVHVGKKRKILVDYPSTSDEEMDEGGSVYDTEDSVSDVEDVEEVFDESTYDEESMELPNKKVFKDNIYKMFDKAVSQSDWTDSEFHDYLVQEYIFEIMSFHQKQNHSANEWITYIKDITFNCGKEDEKNLCRVETIRPYVGTCDFRNQMRTVSCRVSLDGDLYYSGKRCANALKGVVDLYLLVKNKRERKSTFVDNVVITLKKILDSLRD